MFTLVLNVKLQSFPPIWVKVWIAGLIEIVFALVDDGGQWHLQYTNKVEISSVAYHLRNQVSTVSTVKVVYHIITQHSEMKSEALDLSNNILSVSISSFQDLVFSTLAKNSSVVL